MLDFVEPYKNLLLQSSLSISLTLAIVFFRIPFFFLYGLHTYIHPDNPTNGVRAAIRRPDSSDSNPKPPSELRKRTKPKEKDKFDFDESNAQIFRLMLDESHLQSRLYSDDYRSAFTVSFVAIASLILHLYLERGVLVPILLGSIAVFKLLSSTVKISFEKSATRRSEKQLSFCLAVLGVALGVLVTLGFGSSILDFGSIDGFGRFSMAVLMGGLAGLFLVPATKIARSFWLGTDQIRSNMPMITCGWFARAILYANYLAITFTALLWIKPFSELLINKGTNNEIGTAVRLLGNVGFSHSDFAKIRVWSLFASGLLQLVALRPNVQIYLNESLLSWYQRLHASKVPDLEFSRAKVFLHNHYLCLSVMQFIAPALLVLLFHLLSQVNETDLKDYQFVCGFLPCSAFSKEAALFMAWWVNFVLAVCASATIVLFRRGDLILS